MKGQGLLMLMVLPRVMARTMRKAKVRMIQKPKVKMVKMVRKRRMVKPDSMAVPQMIDWEGSTTRV